MLDKCLQKIFSLLFKRSACLITDKSQPNINEIWAAVKDIEILKLNVKNFGYELAKNYQGNLMKIELVESPIYHGLISKPTTQQDLESLWFRYWCSELKIFPIFHRKLWEFAFLLQCLFENNMIIVGKSGIGFGCGEEPIASYLASVGVGAHVTDLEIEKVSGMGWVETNQYASSLEAAFHPSICSREEFENNVSHSYVDMNDIPKELDGKYDFCWSICAMEHLGTIEKGLNFVEQSLRTLKPGGIAIHTTEFNYLSDKITIDNWPTVLFLKEHFETLAKRVNEAGHVFVGPSFDVGNRVLDRFVDIPPYAVGEGWLARENWSDVNQNAHLKLSVDGFPCTCFGILIKKAESVPAIKQVSH